MPRTGNPFDIRILAQRAGKFVEEWKTKRGSERSYAQSFITDLFGIFGMKPNRFGQFERPVCKSDGSKGYADYLADGWLAFEMKKTDCPHLDEAWNQLFGYLTFLPRTELPQILVVSDMKTIEIIPNREKPDKKIIVTVEKLTTDIRHIVPVFAAVYDKYKDLSENDAGKLSDTNWLASRKLAELHRHLRAASAKEPFQENTRIKYMTRFLFLMYAEDSGLVPSKEFLHFVRLLQDGQGNKIKRFFQDLNTPPEHKNSILTYLNGGLFREDLPEPAVDIDVKNALIDGCVFDWSKVSPIEFGTFFQNVLEKKERSEYGAEFTETENLLKIISPLFLDDLRDEFETAKDTWDTLETLHQKIANLNFLDPACGSGNFLSESYVALRELEMDIIAEKQTFRKLNPAEHLRVKPGQFHGIEIQPDAAEIGAVSMWIIEHRMNNVFSERFGIYPPYVKIPLGETVNIKTADSLSADWNTVFEYGNNFSFDYILGNPPYSGGRKMSAVQKNRLQKITGTLPKHGNLDLVAGWFVKAAEYMQTHNTKTAFLATNSICLGEQAAPLWQHLFETLNVRIQFAYPSFKWENGTTDVATVTVIIAGFVPERLLKTPCRLFIEETRGGQKEFAAKEVSTINAYLREAPNIWIYRRTEPLPGNDYPMVFGSMPNDGGLLSDYSTEEKDVIIRKHPETKKYWRQLIGGDEMLKGKLRWCLWFNGCKEKDLPKSKFIRTLLNKVRNYRQRSARETTQTLAKIPHLFGEIRQPKKNFIVIPRISSEKRKYIPIDFFTKKCIIADSCLIIPQAGLEHFGILCSSVHNEWMRVVCGRLEMRYRYSAEIVYNNFPFPKLSAVLREQIGQAAAKVLETRKLCTAMTLAQMYSSMPAALLNAHKELDVFVLSAYGLPADASDNIIISRLFERYEELRSE